MRCRVALLTQQVSNYHVARYRAAERELDELRIYSLMNSADFEEFLSERSLQNVVRIFDGEPSYAHAVSSGALWRRLHKELDSYAPNVVVVAGWSFPESVAAISWARAAGVRVVVMSASQSHDAERSRWRELVKGRVVAACDAAVVAAGPHRDYVERLGIPAGRVYLGYDAVDNDYFSAGADHARAQGPIARAAHDLPERYLLASARFILKKNLPRLVEAFARALAQCDRGHHLVILGDGPERAAIEASAKRHGVADRVRLPGFRRYEALPIFYGLADAFVHVALAEQWGLVISEASASALPLVVSRPCGAATVLLESGVNGFLVEPKNAEEIAAALLKIMNLSDEDRSAMGAASRRKVADWGPDRFGRSLRSACDAAMDCPPRRLSLADQMLFRTLARFRISKVN